MTDSLVDQAAELTDRDATARGEPRAELCRRSGRIDIEPVGCAGSVQVRDEDGGWRATGEERCSQRTEPEPGGRRAPT